MREFRVYEWVDGDLSVYVRNEGEDDNFWVPVGKIRYEDRDRLKSYVAVSEHLDLYPITTLAEGESLWSEFVRPRRW